MKRKHGGWCLIKFDSGVYVTPTNRAKLKVCATFATCLMPTAESHVLPSSYADGAKIII